MKNNKYLFYFIMVMPLVLTGCSPDDQTAHFKYQKHQDYQVKELPLSQNWQTFQCREGRLDARYFDGSHHKISIRFRGNTAVLSRRFSYDPAIFENANLAFYINAKEAVLGRPVSSTLLMTGCKLR